MSALGHKQTFIGGFQVRYVPTTDVRDYARRPRKSVMASEVIASTMTPMP